MTNDIWKQLNDIKKELDSIELQLAMNSEAIESIELDLRFLQAELEYEANSRPF